MPTNDQLIQLDATISGQEMKAALLKAKDIPAAALYPTQADLDKIASAATTSQLNSGLASKQDSLDTASFPAVGDEKSIGLNNTDTVQGALNKISQYVAVNSGTAPLNNVTLADSGNLAELQAKDASVTLDDLLFEWDTAGTPTYTVVPLDAIAGGGSISGADIKTALFAEPDTNNFDDASKLSLAGAASNEDLADSLAAMQATIDAIPASTPYDDTALQASIAAINVQLDAISLWAPETITQLEYNALVTAGTIVDGKNYTIRG